MTKGPIRTLGTASAKAFSEVQQKLKKLAPELYNSERWELLEERLSIILQITWGLNQVHDHKLIHRDLNPRNGMSLDLNSHWGSAVFTDGASVENCRF